MGKMIKNFLLLIMMSAVAGCGGGGGGFSTAPGAVLMGNGLGSLFQKGAIAVEVTTLSSGGSSGLSVTIVDSKGQPLAQPVDVTFSSNCITLGKARVTSPVATSNGVASTTYTAQGCSGNDVISASATVPLAGINHFVSATGVINVLPPVLGSIEFVSATPAIMGLKGSGGAGRSETSVVVFRVKDTSGNIVVGKSVSFSLNTTVGGLSLSPVSALSNSQGLAQTVVAAGTVATSVRVTATITGTDPPISTQSSELVVTSGIPDQNSFSLSIETLNPEGFDFDGEISKVTIRVGDHFNNPVPDGTAVAFTTEGGQIESSCTTGDEGVAGACTINWTSSNPRPADGRVTILATAIGNESFVDGNGNGRLDDPSDPSIPPSGDIFDLTKDDLPEAFRNDNENRDANGDDIRDANEPFLDFNANGLYDLADGKYNGILCSAFANSEGRICGTPKKSVNVRGSGVIVMSGSRAFITITPAPINLSSCSIFSPFINTPRDFTVRVRDINGQVMPKGTTIDVTTTNGTLVGGPGVTEPTQETTTPPVPNTITPPADYVFTIKSDASQTANTPGTSTISFSNTIYTIGEGTPAAKAVITVNRNGSTTGTSTVNYSMADGPVPAATAGLDYTQTVIGTLTFSPGQNVKTFDVPILTDGLVEPNENITLTLSNPSGATLGTSTATLTILEGSTATTQPTPTPPTGSSSTLFTCKQGNDSSTGILTVKVTTPGGVVSIGSATVND